MTKLFIHNERKTSSFPPEKKHKIWKAPPHAERIGPPRVRPHFLVDFHFYVLFLIILLCEWWIVTSTTCALLTDPCLLIAECNSSYSWTPARSKAPVFLRIPPQGVLVLTITVKNQWPNGECTNLPPHKPHQPSWMWLNNKGKVRTEPSGQFQTSLAEVLG